MTYRFLYTLFMAVNTNFRPKLKNRGLNDVSLSPGWSYYVCDGDYRSYWKAHQEQVEVNYCQSNLHAVDHANKKLRNYLASGVGACKCTRHTFVCSNGVGDLQKGEK